METLRLFEVEPLPAGYLGACPVRGCKRRHWAEGAREARCPDHGILFRYRRIDGHYSGHRCGGACLNALGPSCDCSCGGRNHGRGWA